MDIKEFIHLHEYINSYIDEDKDEIISILNDVKYDLLLIKETLHIDDKNIDDRISDN